MGIRAKLLLLLLFLAVVPLMGVSWLVHSTVSGLGVEVGKRSTDALTGQLTQRIQHIVQSGALLFSREKHVIELALINHANEAEELLNSPAPAAPAYVFGPEDYEGTGTAPPDLAPSSFHGRRGGQGAAEENLVSLSEQVIYLTPDTDGSSVTADIARMSQMTDVYRRIYQRRPEVFLWIYTALKSGVHSSYPGHGGFPPGYDPRERDWYLHAAASTTPVWNPPYVDATTRQLVTTVSTALRGADGRIEGVAAMDVQIIPSLKAITSGLGMPDGASALLVEAEGPDTGEPPGLKVLVRRQPETTDWQADVQMADLTSRDEQAFTEMSRRVREGRGGVWRMEFEGRESIWAHAPFDDGGIQLLVVVPMAEVVDQVRETQHYIRGESDKQLRLVALITFITVCFVTAAVLYSARTVSEPIRTVADAAKRLARGDFSARSEVRNRDEIGDLSNAFNDMVPKLLAHIEYRDALALAEEVQQNLLPLTAPTLEGFDVSGRTSYCDETGGDYYDFFGQEDLGGGRIGFVIGDVSGHGVSSALLMASARACLRSLLARDVPISEIFRSINRQLAADVSKGRFMTLFILIADTVTGQVNWVSAGHDPAILYDPATDTFEELSSDDIPLGIDQGWDYAEQSRRLIPNGAVILAGTDGIWETRNEAGQEFGKGALREAMKRHASRPAAEIAEAIDDALVSFRGSAPQRDDATLVVLKATG